jgi:hypothetical protein
MSKNRQRLRALTWCWLLLAMVWWAFLAVLPAWGGSPTSAGYKALPGKSPVVVLSGEFFQAMEKLANSGAVYGDRQELFLEQIATAQRFVVKTNLTLIDQNEKIIRLLEELNRRGQGEKR